MITHRMLPARDLRNGLAIIVVLLPGHRTIRSRIELLMRLDKDLIKVAFASGDILTLSANTMVGLILPPAHQPRQRPPWKPRNAS